MPNLHELKKMRKEFRKINAQVFDHFWDTVKLMGFKHRVRLIWKIIWHPRLKK